MPTLLSLLRSTPRTTARFGVTCFIATALLAGCASKNPLIDGPALATSTPLQASASSPAVNAAKDNAPVTTVIGSSESASAAAANKGLQRIAPTTVRRFFGVFSPYRVDIPQGNFVTEEMLVQLKEGMTRDQVKFVLGTPLIADIFHADRWTICSAC